MPLVLQLHIVMMSKYSQFGADTFNTFWVMVYIKVFAWHRQQSSDHFFWNRQAKKRSFTNFVRFLFFVTSLLITCNICSSISLLTDNFTYIYFLIYKIWKLPQFSVLVLIVKKSKVTKSRGKSEKGLSVHK